jgi:hypothetical protein
MSSIFNNTEDLVLKIQGEHNKEIYYLQPQQKSDNRGVDGFAAYKGSSQITSYYGAWGSHVWKVRGDDSFIIQLEIFKNDLPWNKNYDIHDKSIVKAVLVTWLEELGEMLLVRLLLEKRKVMMMGIGINY